MLGAHLCIGKECSLCCPRRKGTLVKSTVLVFIAGALMGFSRSWRMPAMVIVGRFITGVHSGWPGYFLEFIMPYSSVAKMEAHYKI